LNGGTIFQRATEDHWTRRAVGRPPSFSAEGIITPRSFLTDRFLQKKPISHADVNNSIFTEPGKATTTDTIRHMIARLPGIKVAIGIPTEEDRVQSDPQEVEAHFDPFNPH
jgi:hypothetical protein